MRSLPCGLHRTGLPARPFTCHSTCEYQTPEPDAREHKHHNPKQTPALHSKTERESRNSLRENQN